MHADSIIAYLKKHGQRLDSEIAAGTGIPLTKVNAAISLLSERGEISHCRVTRFNGDQEFKGTLCRLRGYIPPKAPGRKPGA